jgi:diadenosine tetraphosphate (Ap4A) HIT family hydrolase
VPEQCEICRRLPLITPYSPYFIAELETGFAVLGDHQVYEGYTIFIAKKCVPELHELERAERQKFLEEMSLVAEAVFNATKPRKLNYELLGNSVSHLHWHLFPRYANDPDPKWPVWNDPRIQSTALATAPRPDRAHLDDLRTRIQHELTALLPHR